MDGAGNGENAADLVDLWKGLVGLHSLWDYKMGFRRAVGWEALKAFL